MSFRKKKRKQTDSEKIKPIKPIAPHDPSLHPRCWPSPPPDAPQKVIIPFKDKEIDNKQ